MYDLKKGTLNDAPITAFAVWWQVPCKGLFPDLAVAVAAAEAMDLDPQTCVRPCPVAISGESYEVMM